MDSNHRFPATSSQGKSRVLCDNLPVSSAGAITNLTTRESVAPSHANGALRGRKKKEVKSFIIIHENKEVSTNIITLFNYFQSVVQGLFHL